MEQGNRGRPFRRFVEFDNVTSEANCHFKNWYSRIYFWQKLRGLRKPLPAPVLRLRTFSLLYFCLCWILYLLQVSVEGFITLLVHSFALRSWCSFALCIFINESSAFTNESPIVWGGQNILMASRLRIVIFKCLVCIFDLLKLGFLFKEV